MTKSPTAAAAERPSLAVRALNRSRVVKLHAHSDLEALTRLRHCIVFDNEALR